MCTLLVAFQRWPGTPILVAANRDEMLARPATPPFLWPTDPPILAPRDDLAGGSWLGLNRHGLFVGITNRAGAARDPKRRSRGELVMDALHATSAEALHRRLSDLDPRRYNAFHLLYADASAARLTWSDGERIHQETLAPGVHVVTERSLGAADTARTDRLREGFESFVQAGEPSLESVAPLMRQHEGDPFAGTCVHADAFGYGTRSSLLLSIHDAAPARLLWAEGRPCTHPYVDQSDLVRELAEVKPR